jgi:hypothetical protein
MPIEPSSRFCRECGVAVTTARVTTVLPELVASGVSDKMITLADNSAEPGTPKSSFTALDDQVVVWAKLHKVNSNEVAVYFCWYGPDGQLYTKSPLVLSSNLGPYIYAHSSHKIRDTSMSKKNGTWKAEILLEQNLVSTVNFSIAGAAPISTPTRPSRKIKTPSIPSAPVPSPFVKSCPSCGAQLSSDKKFCTECGSPLVVKVPTADLKVPSPVKFCGQCGIALDPGLKFCGNCGTPTTATGDVQSAPPPRPSAMLTGSGPMFAGQENVIGGFADSGVWRDRPLGLGKYGIYFTQTRLIGVKHSAVDKGKVAGTVAEGTIDLLVGEGILSNMGKTIGRAVGSAVGKGIETSIASSESKHLLEDLDKKKDFEAYRQDISFIELRNPPGALKSGKVVIAMNSGGSIEIQFAGKENSQRLSALLQSFYPQAFRLVG